MQQEKSLSLVERYIVMQILTGQSFYAIDSIMSRQFLKDVIPEYTGTSLINQCSDVITKLSIRITEYFSSKLEENKIFSNKIQINVPTFELRLIRTIIERMRLLKENVPPYVALETDDWKSNKQIKISSVIFNFTTFSNRKANFVAEYKKVKCKTEADHKDFLIGTCEKYHTNNLWVNTCTDNASAVLHCTSELASDENYAVYAGHISCLCHILNLVCESVIRCVSSEEGVDELLEMDDELLSGSDEEEDEFINADIFDLVTDPFSGKSPEVLLKLVKFGAEVRKSADKLKVYDKYVTKRIPAFCSVGWDIKYNILKLFVEHHEEMFRFFKHCRNIGEPLINELDQKDLEIAKLLIGVVKTYEELIGFASRNHVLSPLYVPVLIFIRETLMKTNNVLREMGDQSTNFDPAIEMIDKYLNQTKENFEVIFASVAFLPEFKHFKYIKEYYKSTFNKVLNPRDLLANILVKLGRFQPVINILDSEQPKVPLDTPIIPSQPDATFDTFEPQVFNIISAHLDEEYDDCINFIKSSFTLEFEKKLRLKGIRREDTQDGIGYFKQRDGKKLRVSDVEIFLFKAEICIDVQHQYRKETNKDSSKLNSHQFLPVAMDYLFSFSVTSINVKRSLSDLKRNYKDRLHMLKDRTAFCTANVTSVEKSCLDMDILESFEKKTLKEVLGYKKID